MVKLFEGARKEWRFVLAFLALSIVFWLAQFVYQFYVLIPGEFGGALVRSFALSGATLIGLALLSSSFFKFYPKYAKYWYVRRSLGVVGFAFIALHFWSVINFLFQGKPQGIFYSLHPIENPIIPGFFAYMIFFLMAITSTDWAVEKLSYPRWKALHRLVYLGYFGAVFHYLTINPALLVNAAGYLLLVVTFLALAGQLYWFIRATAKYNFSTLGAKIGFLVILLYLGFGYLVFVAPSITKQAQQAPVVEESLEVAIEKMKELMEKEGGNKGVLTAPVQSDREFSGSTEKLGRFTNINYMTSGSATLQKKDNKFFVVFGENFSTPNGPNLVVYLTKNTTPTTREDIKAGIVLGELKSIVGKQVYEVPSGIDVKEFNSVSIHCRAFNVPWSYAVIK